MDGFVNDSILAPFAKFVECIYAAHLERLRRQSRRLEDNSTSFGMAAAHVLTLVFRENVTTAGRLRTRPRPVAAEGTE